MTPPPSAPDTAAIDPRLQARSAAVRSAKRRRRVRAAGIVGCVLALAGVGYAIAYSPLLSVQRIDVSGTHYTDPAAVAALAGGERGSALLTADLGRVERAVEALPWVESAEVTRRWPRAVAITVVERTPAASMLQSDGTWAIVDGGGHVLAVEAGQPMGLVPVVAGGAPLAPGSVAEGWRREAVSAAGRLAPGITARLASVRLDPGGGIALDLQGGGTLWLGTTEDLATKQVEALAVLTSLGDAPVGVVDVRAPGTPVHVPAPPPPVEPAPSPDPLTSAVG